MWQNGDLVPLRCARRIVVDADHEPGLIGQLLHQDLVARVTVSRKGPPSPDPDQRTLVFQ